MWKHHIRLKASTFNYFKVIKKLSQDNSPDAKHKLCLEVFLSEKIMKEISCNNQIYSFCEKHSC